MASGIVITLFFCTIYSSKCEPFQIRKDNLDKALVGHSFLEINDTNLHDCARNCMSIAICKSFEYNRNERSCKLNDMDKSSVDPSEIVTKKGSIYSDIMEWPRAIVKECSTRPCRNNQRCLVNGGSYVCRDITCTIPQQLENGKIQVYAPDENKFRDKALVKCVNGYFPSQREVECQASGQWQPAVCKKLSDCKEIFDKSPQAKSGLYEIELWKSGIILTVNCDMETGGGGWTLVHRRLDGSVDFNRNFTEYEDGFGNANGEFWIGLKYIKELAEKGSTELRLDVTKENYEKGYETYQDFELTDGMNYMLNIGTRVATAGIAEGLQINNKKRFSTFERDLDIASSNCAKQWQGGWWYKSCSIVNLNGLYSSPGTLCYKGSGLDVKCGHWHKDLDGFYALRSSNMMLRRI